MGTPMPFILSNNDQYRSTSYLAKNPIGDDPKPQTPTTPAASNMKSNRNNNNGTTTSTKTGRKNGKQGSSASSSQNKQPQRQRGVGIAQLEKMRRMNGEATNINTTPYFHQQQHLTTLHQIQTTNPPHHPAYPFIDPISASNGIPISSPLNQAVKFGGGGTIGVVGSSGQFLGFHNNVVAQVGSSSGQIVHPGGYYHGSDLRFRVLDHMGMNGLDGSLKELPSFPKVDQQGYYQEDQDVFAFKKKKVSGSNCYGYHTGGAAGREHCHDHQGVEVVAVHTKGNAAGPGGGKVVMEYGFFPSTGKVTDDDHEIGGTTQAQISNANRITTSLSVAPPFNYALPTTHHQPSVSLDLSLKL